MSLPDYLFQSSKPLPLSSTHELPMASHSNIKYNMQFQSYNLQPCYQFIPLSA